MADEERQIKSKERVRERGEVFTAAREVNAMLDLVKDETENIDSTFLEPACGDGNFLDEVLRRKLAVCKKRYGKSAADYEKMSFLACTTLYGVDIMADNVAHCRERLFETWELSFVDSGTVSATVGRGLRPRRSDFHDRVSAAVRKVFEKNVLLGNALSMKRVDEKGNDLDEPIVFTEWKFALGDKLKREEYRFDVLLEKGESAQGESIWGTKRENVQVMSFDFGDSADASSTDAAVNWMVDPDDPEKKRMIPAPSRVYPLIDYWRIGDGEGEGGR